MYLLRRVRESVNTSMEDRDSRARSAQQEDVTKPPLSGHSGTLSPPYMKYMESIIWVRSTSSRLVLHSSSHKHTRQDRFGSSHIHPIYQAVCE